MDLRIAIALLIFSLSLNSIGQLAGIGEFENRVDINEVREDLDFEFPEPDINTTDDNFAQAIQESTTTVSEFFNELFSVFEGLIGLLQLAIPTITGVAWFDLLVWLPMLFAVSLGILNWLRGK